MPVQMAASSQQNGWLVEPRRERNFAAFLELIMISLGDGRLPNRGH
jgi:hypothetical protein